MAIFLQNVFQPAILFFILGILAQALKTGLTIPQPISKLLSLYLLIALGFKGGFQIHQASWNVDFFYLFLWATLFSFSIPLTSFFILKRFIQLYDAIVIAASFGSVSAVTFMTATNFLQEINASFHPFMIALMAWMESPAIWAGLILYTFFSKKQSIQWGHVIKQSVLNSSVFLLLGSLCIGFMTGKKGWEMVKPFLFEPFAGILTLFLLDMGLASAKRFAAVKEVGLQLILFGIAFPFLYGVGGLIFAYCFALQPGDALLFSLLLASASYIAVPAVMRSAIQEANPSVYLSLALAITFPFNLAINLPFLWTAIQRIWN